MAICWDPSLRLESRFYFVYIECRKMFRNLSRTFDDNQLSKAMKNDVQVQKKALFHLFVNIFETKKPHSFFCTTLNLIYWSCFYSKANFHLSFSPSTFFPIDSCWHKKGQIDKKYLLFFLIMLSNNNSFQMINRNWMLTDFLSLYLPPRSLIPICFHGKEKMICGFIQSAMSDKKDVKD